MTRTFATLEVSEPTFDEIRAKLVQAGYSHAIREDPGFFELIDMHGIALVCSTDEESPQADGSPE
jgi:hypothetical protein